MDLTVHLFTSGSRSRVAPFTDLFTKLFTISAAVHRAVNRWPFAVNR